MRLQKPVLLLSFPYLTTPSPFPDSSIPLPSPPSLPSQSANRNNATTDPLTVKTITGTYTGAPSSQYPTVLEFRSIPFAQPPVGPLRWAPPQPLPPSDRHTYATRLAPACPQYVPWRQSVWNMQIRDFMVQLPAYQSYTSGLMTQSSAEDCLYLAIWKPFTGHAGEAGEDGEEEEEESEDDIGDILRQGGEVGSDGQEGEVDSDSGSEDGEEDLNGEDEDDGEEPVDPDSRTTQRRASQNPKLKPRPKKKKQKKLLPVVFFMTGGSFQSGGIDIPYQLPAQWVSRTSSHIVVTINYRVNIFGFPNAAGLSTSQNVGILDQRLALEWVRDNIEAFGGDPDHIVMWGQSAGGVSADVHSYAFWDDIIVKGLFMQSGSAMRKTFWFDTPGFTNFSFVARNLGCGTEEADDVVVDAAAELDCMRQVPATLIENFVGRYSDAASDDNYTTLPALVFRPRPDDRLIWRNWTELALAGKVARVPALVSNTANEQSSMHRYPVRNVAAGPDQVAVDRQTVDGFVCVTSNTTANRAANGLVTYRYQYAGNFSNLTPLWWMGAYHSSDTPLLMGTYDLNGNSTGFEKRVSEVMQDWVYEFVMDPENGLKRRGWLPIGGAVEDGGMVMRFAVGNKVQQKIDSREIDDSCWGKAEYDHHPGYADEGSDGGAKPGEMVPIAADDDGPPEGEGVNQVEEPSDDIEVEELDD